MHSRQRLGVRELVTGALLVGINVVLTRFLAVVLPIGGVAGLRIGFGPLALYLAGIILGPLGGAVVGVVADVLGTLLLTGSYFPGFTLSAALTGLVPGLIAHRTDARGNVAWPGIVRIFLAILVANVIVSLGLNPIWLSIMYRRAWTLFTAARFIAQAVQIPLFTILTALLTRAYIAMRQRA